MDLALAVLLNVYIILGKLLMKVELLIAIKQEKLQVWAFQLHDLYLLAHESWVLWD